MKITLQHKERNYPPVWIPYLYGDEIDIKSIQEALFGVLKENKPNGEEVFHFLFEFCSGMAKELNLQFGYTSEEDLQVKGAVVIHKALMECADQDLR